MSENKITSKMLGEIRPKLDAAVAEVAENKPEKGNAYIGELPLTVAPYRGFVVETPKYKDESVYGRVLAHVEYAKTTTGSYHVMVWAEISNKHFRWYVTDFHFRIRETDSIETEPEETAIIGALLNALNESQEFHEGMLNALDSCNWMLDKLAR